MIIAIALDDGLGMTFNKRRQSRDRVLFQDLLNSTKKLWINDYTAKIFPPEEKVSVSEDFLSLAEKEDVCFVENIDVSKLIDDADGVIIYRWNRSYPRDMTFKGNLGQFRLIEEREFEGYSHEKITKEVYIR